MTKQLLLPGHVEHVAGFGPFRAALESVYGPLSPQALASNIFGLYAGLVYLTPLAGGFIADRWLGRTASITIGALTMAVGHFLMAFDFSFLLALLCLLLGVGFFKGNIATQVGELYGPDDLRRADAFQIFLLAVNIAVIISPLVCGTLGQKVAWHWGFGAAGVGMVIGLLIYLSGRRWLPKEKGRRRRGDLQPRPTDRLSCRATGPGSSSWSCSCRCSSCRRSATSRSSTPISSGAMPTTIWPSSAGTDAGHLAALARRLHLDRDDRLRLSSSGAGGARSIASRTRSPS